MVTSFIKQMDPKTKKMNPMYKLDSDPKPIRMPIGNLNDMVLGPSKQAIMEYEKDISLIFPTHIARYLFSGSRASKPTR